MESQGTMAIERRETIQELSDLFFVVKAMGHRLANQTHGDAYDLVRQLNDLLHQTHLKLTQIEESA